MMKAYILILILASLTLSTSAQENTDRKGTDEMAPSLLKRKHNREIIPVYNENLEDLCVKYKNIKNTGIGLAATGAGLLVGGSIMMVSSRAGNIYISDGGKPYRGTSPLRKGGIAAVTVGTLSILAGIPMAAWGAIKIKKTCHRTNSTDNAYLQLNTGQDGVGVAMKF